MPSPLPAADTGRRAAPEIRQAAPDDTDQITDIYNFYVQTSLVTLQGTPSTPQDIRSHLEKLVASGMPYLVAVDPSTSSKRVLGFAYADAFSPRSGYDATAEDTVYVHPSGRQQGVGRALLRAVLRSLLAQGKKTVVAKLSIKPSEAREELPSYRLHVSLGARQVGRLEGVGWKLGSRVDVLLLQIDLV